MDFVLITLDVVIFIIDFTFFSIINNNDILINENYCSLYI